MTLAESARIGVGRRPCARSNSRIAWVASTPFITGIWMSIQDEGRKPPPAEQIRRASRCPSAATRRSIPSGASIASSRTRLVLLSSAARTRSCGDVHLIGRARSASGSGRLGPRATWASAGRPIHSSGSSTVKVDPRPSTLATEIDPPISSTSSRDIAKPRPLPPNLRVTDGSTCENRWNSCTSWGPGIPTPVSVTEAETPTAVRLSSRGGWSAPPAAPRRSAGELDGVRGEVAEHLADLAGVPPPRPQRLGVDLNPEGDGLAPGGVGEGAGRGRPRPWRGRRARRRPPCDRPRSWRDPGRR